MSAGFQNGGKQDDKAKDRTADQPADWDALKDDVADIANEALERGRGFVASARDQATGYVDQRKDDVAQSVADLANSLREACSSFKDAPNVQAFVDSAAEGLDQFAESIRERSFAEMFNDVEVVMRRRPALVAGVAVTAGFMLARFIKASSEGMRDMDRQMDRQAAYQGRGGPRRQA